MAKETEKKPIFSNRFIQALNKVRSMSAEEIEREAEKATPEKLRLLMFRENHKHETLH